ncbi:unnamed protein product [Rhizopus stolonifer]
MEQSNNGILDSYESTENALMDSFKAAALKVTTLYKDSLVQNRKAYAAGYQQALQDLYEFISRHPEQGYIPVEQIDPQSQFTFTHEMPHMRPMEGLWEQNNTMDGHKRRLGPNELMFMGRSMNMDTNNEPPYKRNRPRRDEEQPPFGLPDPS